MGNLNNALPGTPCGTQAGAVAGREVGSGNFSHRVVKWFGNAPEREPTDPSYIGSFTAQDGAGTKGEVGKGSPRIATNRTNENSPSSREAHHVSSHPEKDCGISKSAMGENKGAAEEGCIVSLAASIPHEGCVGMIQTVN
jgi:hypothetical protein